MKLKGWGRRLSLALVVCSFNLTGYAQEISAVGGASTSSANTAVPGLINYSGVLKDADAKPLTGVTGVTFLLYKEEQGGAPVWIETQNVVPGKKGEYTVTLGSVKLDGSLAQSFANGEPRWLGVQVAGQPEQPRVLLVAVPYAMKAADAQTLGGLPASAFVLATPPSSGAAPAATGSSAASLSSASPSSPTPSSAPPPATSNVTTTGGTASTISMFTTATNIQNSILTQTGATAINVGGRLNLPALGTATAAAGFTSRPLDFVASVFNSTTSTAVPQTFQWQAEPLNNNKTTASGTLNLLYATGTAVPAETGLSINSKGLFTFAAGQSFPGTVKSVGLAAPASDFTVSGSPVTGTGTLSFAWNVAPTSANTPNAIVKRDGSGNFSASTIAAGTVNAAALFGNGAGVTNVNAAALGGLAPGAFAQLAAANNFTASQTINGGLGVAGTIQLSGSGNGIIFPDGTTQQTGALFKTATSGFIFPGAGVTNLLQLNITVPTNGLLSASASGYCNINTGSSSVQWAYIIGLSASEGWSFPMPLVYFPSGSNVAQLPITGERIFTVSAGTNSIFLNVDNIIGTPLGSCGALLTAIFTPAQLP